MSLLELIDVGKRAPGPGERWILRGACLQIEAGELVGVWGRRHSGRSTLLRLAAGLEAPDEGTVRLAGNELDAGTHRSGVRMCRRRFRAIDGEVVLDQLVVSQLACGVQAPVARSRAALALECVGVQQCAMLRPTDLATGELVLVAIARSLAHAPKLLVVDEPTLGVELAERDRVLTALRSLAGGEIAVLMSAGETASLSGADRVLALSGGRLRGESAAAKLAPVVDLRARRGVA